MHNYIELYEEGATMAMQPEGWMTATLFSHWISHFIQSLQKKGGISPSNRHLLIVDGHSSHVTMEVVHKAMEVGLDILTLPSHTSHRLQPLDVSVFGPFKRAFKRYRDAWTLQHCGRGATKMVLAQWVSAALQKSLTESNIKAGFRSIGIWPLNSRAVDQYITPSLQFTHTNGTDDQDDDTDVDEELEGYSQEPQPPMEQYFIGTCEPIVESGGAHSAVVEDTVDNSDITTMDTNQSNAVETSAGRGPLSSQGIQRFFQLPEVAIAERRRKNREELLVDFSKSIMRTSNDYLHSMEMKAARKEKAWKEAEVRKVEAEKRKDA